MSGGVELVDQAFDYGVVRVNHPAAALLVENFAVVLVDKGHDGVFLAPGGVFCGCTPGKECDDDGQVLWIMRANSLWSWG